MSALCTVRFAGDDAEVLRARIYLSAVGVGHLREVEIDASDGYPGAGERIIFNVEAGLSLSCTVSYVEELAGRARFSAVLGAGGTGRTVQPRAFERATSGDVLRYLCAQMGEELDVSSSLGLRLDAYTQPAQAGVAALWGLAERLGLVWRITPAGRVWMGSATYPAARIDGDVLSTDGLRRTYAVERPELIPPARLDGADVLAVLHTVEPEQVRTIAEMAGAAPRGDELRSAMGAWLRSELGISTGAAPVYDLLALYPAEVVASDVNGRWVEVMISDVRLPPLGRIKIRWGLPGVRAQVEQRTRCFVGWEGGDPRRPYVAAWADTTPIKIVLDASVIWVGGESGQPAAQATSLKSQLDAFQAWAAAHVHGAGPPPNAPPTFGDFGADKVRVA